MDNGKSFMTLLLIHLLIFYSSSTIQFCTATTDTITSTQPIHDPHTIVSSGATFKLGFFSPSVNSTNRYVGIWYNDASAKAVVWVANRDQPLNGTSGTVTISKDGNLVILDGQKQIVWSSDVPNSLMNSSARLSSSGNLILRDDSNGNTIWQSFEHPSDSFLPAMQIGTSKKTQMTSWKSPSDPSTGSFTCGINPLIIPEAYIWNGSDPYWRSGPWNGQIFIGISDMVSVYYSRFEIVDDKISYNYENKSSLLYHTLTPDGILVQKYQEQGKETWETMWSAQHTECDVYGKCGPFGSCNIVQGRSTICTCLQGFHPKNMEEWSRGNWSGGCLRRSQLQCERNNSTGGEKGKEDGFLKLKTMKVPAFAELSTAYSEDKCKSECLNNCSCIAFAYNSGIGCMEWSGDLIDIQKFSDGGADLYIRVPHSELEKKRHTKLVIKITVPIGSLTIAICIYGGGWLDHKVE